MVRKQVPTIMLVVAALFVMAVVAVVRLRHPEMTEIQLFLAYWPYWVCGLIVLLSLAVWLRKVDRD